MGSMKLISFYMVLNTVSLLLSTMLAPILGTVVDYSTKRKLYTFGTVAVYCGVNAVQTFTSESNWLFMAGLAMFVQKCAYAFHVACVAAYCTEIAENDEEIIALQGAGRIVELVSMMALLGAIMVAGVLTGNDIGRTAMIGQILATVYSIPVVYLSYARLEDRPALHTGDRNLWAVFSQLHATCKDLRRDNFYVFQFLIGLMFADSANFNIIGLLPIYCMQQLNIENPSSIVGLTIVFCIPGALLTKRISTSIGMRRQLGNLILSMAIITAVTVLFVYKEGQGGIIMVGAVLFGLALGGAYPCQKGLFMSIVPAGQEVEFQGLYAFFASILSFVPAAWFAFCVDFRLGGEQNSRRLGMLCIILFQLLGFFLCSFSLDDKKAKELAKKTLHLRHRGQKTVDGSAKVDHAAEAENGIELN
jgi:MFS-type transporter involved in bile tolerance (Atg22 family)